MNLPMPEYGANDKETIQNLMDTVIKLRKELEYLMYHLGDANIPDLAGMKGDINGNHSLILQAEDEIELLVTDVEGNTASIIVQAGQIASLVSDVAGNTSSITQLAGQITLKVDKNGVISAINLSPEGVSISADKINLDGVVTMTNLAQVYGTLAIGNPYSNYARIILGLECSIRGMGDVFEINSASVHCGPIVSGGSVFANDFQTNTGITLTGVDNAIDGRIEKGQYVKRIGAGSDRLYILFEDGSVHEVMFT